MKLPNHKKAWRLSKYFHTMRYLRWEQFYFRLYKSIRPIKLNIHKPVKVRAWSHVWNAPVYKNQSLFENGKCSFLNQEAIINDAADWNDASKDKLWLYYLHYFDDVDSKGAEKRAPVIRSWMLRWIKENPPIFGNGWEAFTLSLRIINWIKYLSKCDLDSQEINESIALQSRVLEQRLEYHLLANHLLVNALALIFAGCWLEGAQADGWFKKGLKIFERELNEQFLPDGGHFELSPMYHAQVLIYVLDVMHLAYTSQNKQLLSRIGQFEEIFQKGLRWLEAMHHPDENISFFNDAAFANSPSINLLKKYAELMAIKIPLSADNACTHLADSGFIRVKSGKALAILDVGPIGPDYQPGHAHADTLSFELSIGQKRLIVNSGTSQYGSGPERDWQRSTKAHNTVCINDMDSSEVWGGFRVARRAKPFDLSIDQKHKGINIRCSHDGYKRLHPGLVHTREWSFNNNQLSVCDRVSNANYPAVAYYHLHPDAEVKQVTSNSVQVYLDGHDVTLNFSDSELSVEDGYWCPEFGIKVSNKLVKVHFISKLEMHIEWV